MAFIRGGIGRKRYLSSNEKRNILAWFKINTNTHAAPPKTFQSESNWAFAKNDKLLENLAVQF